MSDGVALVFIVWEEGPARRAGDLLGVPNFSDGRRVGFGGKYWLPIPPPD
jgi:hypothetical protein